MRDEGTAAVSGTAVRSIVAVTVASVEVIVWFNPPWPFNS